MILEEWRNLDHLEVPQARSWLFDISGGFVVFLVGFVIFTTFAMRFNTIEGSISVLCFFSSGFWGGRGGFFFQTSPKDTNQSTQRLDKQIDWSDFLFPKNWSVFRDFQVLK